VYVLCIVVPFSADTIDISSLQIVLTGSRVTDLHIECVLGIKQTADKANGAPPNSVEALRYKSGGRGFDSRW
jgi:hypothetical protein